MRDAQWLAGGLVQSGIANRDRLAITGGSYGGGPASMAALPMYTFGDLIQVLAPNGRGSDGWDLAPADGDHSVPFGVPLDGTVSGLLTAAELFRSLAPPGSDPAGDLVASTDRLLDGNPFPTEDPRVAEGVRLYRGFKSPITIEPGTRVPIFRVQRFTDALFRGRSDRRHL